MCHKKLNWDNLIKEQKIKIKHFVINGVYLGTIVYTDPNITSQINYGLAVVSPKEPCPSKEKGRQIAYGRYLKSFLKNGEIGTNILTNLTGTALNRFSSCKLSNLLEFFDRFYKIKEEIENAENTTTTQSEDTSF